VNRSNEGRLADEERGRARVRPTNSQEGRRRNIATCRAVPSARLFPLPSLLPRLLSFGSSQRFFSNLQPKRSVLQDGRRTARREREGSQPVGEILQHPIHSTEQERERGGREGGRKVEG